MLGPKVAPKGKIMMKVRRADSPDVVEVIEVPVTSKERVGDSPAPAVADRSQTREE